MNKPTTIDEYIAPFPPEVSERLSFLRKLAHEIVPNAEEAIKYGIPTFVKDKNLFHFAGYKNHIGFYPTPKGIEAFEERLQKYPQGKGSVQFPLNEELPVELIRDMMEFLGA